MNFNVTLNPNSFPVSENRNTTIRTAVNEFAEKANQLSNQFLAKEKNYKGPRVIRNNYYYSPFYSPWYFSRPSYIVIDHGRPGRGDRDYNNGAFLLGVLATIGTLIASYAVGRAMVTHRDAKDELEDTKMFQHQLAAYQSFASEEDRPLIQEASRAASLKGRICSRIKNSSAWDLALRVTLTASLVFTAVGCLALVPPLLAAGIVFSITSAVAMMFKWGFESMDKSTIRDAEYLRASLLNLQKL